MIPGEFDYERPASLAQAIALLRQHGDRAKLLAGGQSLIPAMRFRLAAPEVLIDISKLEDLAYIREERDGLVVGALTREVALESSPVVAARYSMLADAARVVADPLVRNLATVGGNLAHADPANDHPAVMLAYDAVVVAEGANGRRAIAIDDLFTGLFETSLGADEILVEIQIPAPERSTGGAYVKFERKVGDYAVAAVAVQLQLDGDTCVRARVGLTNVSAVPMRANSAEALLIDQSLTDGVVEAAGKAAAAECDPSADLRGPVEYKRDLVRVLLKRAVRQAVARVKGETV